jgi:hypothetical protein
MQCAYFLRLPRRGKGQEGKGGGRICSQRGNKRRQAIREWNPCSLIGPSCLTCPSRLTGSSPPIGQVQGGPSKVDRPPSSCEGWRRGDVNQNPIRVSDWSIRETGLRSAPAFLHFTVDLRPNKYIVPDREKKKSAPHGQSRPNPQSGTMNSATEGLD